MAAAQKTVSIYMTENEVIELLNLKDRPSYWPEVRKIVEADGFPRVDPLFNGRHRQAVELWCARRAGLTEQVALPPDGVERVGQWRRPVQGLKRPA